MPWFSVFILHISGKFPWCETGHCLKWVLIYSIVHKMRFSYYLFNWSMEVRTLAYLGPPNETQLFCLSEKGQSNFVKVNCQMYSFSEVNVYCFSLTFFFPDNFFVYPPYFFFSFHISHFKIYFFFISLLIKT